MTTTRIFKSGTVDVRESGRVSKVTFTKRVYPITGPVDVANKLEEAGWVPSNGDVELWEYRKGDWTALIDTGGPLFGGDPEPTVEFFHSVKVR